MGRLDIRADLNDDDGSGRIAALLSEASKPDLVRVGALVVAGSEAASAVCEVTAIEPTSGGDTLVHLRVLPAPSRSPG